jgi:hypothetical protein
MDRESPRLRAVLHGLDIELATILTEDIDAFITLLENEFRMHLEHGGSTIAIRMFGHLVSSEGEFGAVVYVGKTHLVCLIAGLKTRQHVLST